VVVLKGAATVLYAGGCGYVNTTGNPYMAAGGSGDVLSGIIAGLLAQSLSPLDAAAAGVFVHGLAGDLAHREHGGPIIASDIISSLPRALAELSAGAPMRR
jgi:ADP-dependent NAD(P)H-hydrate dehydratase / NAD(P)H-hydrate epimerase